MKLRSICFMYVYNKKKGYYEGKEETFILTKLNRKTIKTKYLILLFEKTKIKFLNIYWSVLQLTGTIL